MNPEKKENKKGGARLAGPGGRPAQAPPVQSQSGGKDGPANAKGAKGQKSGTGRQKALHILFLVATVLAAIIVVLFVISKFIFVEPELPPKQVPDPPLPSGEEAPPSEALIESSDRKKNFYTFLIIGRDTGGGGNTDTIMLVAYDVHNQKLAVMNIPRDTMVNIPYDIKRINAVYNYNGAGEEGIQALYKEVSQLVGFQPDYDVVVEWEGFGRLVDAIGGVDFNVPLNMYYDDPTQDLHIRISKGQQHLNGEQAMQVIRFRKNNDGTGYPDGDIGRIATQQAFMKDVIAQCLSASNIINNVGKYAQIFTECVDTDLTVNNLAWFAQQALIGGLKVEDVTFVTMPGNYNAAAWSRTYGNYQSYVLPLAEELMTVVNEHFNPYLEERTAGQLDIMRVNRDGSLSSSTGVVEDSRAAVPPVRPTPAPTPVPEETPTPPVEPTQAPATPSPEPGGTPSTPPSTTPTAPPAESVAPTAPPVESAPVSSQGPVETTTPPTGTPATPSPAPTPGTPPPASPDPTPPVDSGVILPPEAFE